MLLNSGFQACTITPGSLISDVTFFTTFTKRSVLEDTGNAELNKHSLWNCSRSIGSHPQHGTETCRAKREGAWPPGPRANVIAGAAAARPGRLRRPGSRAARPRGGVGRRLPGLACASGTHPRPRDRKETEAATVTCQPKMEPRRAEPRLC